MGARSGVMGRGKERVGAHDYRAAGGVSAVAAATLSPPGHCNRYSSTRKGAIGLVFFLRNSERYWLLRKPLAKGA